jgi:hypothetical protein
MRRPAWTGARSSTRERREQPSPKHLDVPSAPMRSGANATVVFDSHKERMGCCGVIFADMTRRDCAREPSTTPREIRLQLQLDALCRSHSS